MKADLVKAASEVIPSQHILVNMVSRRVRQLCSGYRPLVQVPPGMDAADIALTEIINEKLTFESTFSKDATNAPIVQCPGIIVAEDRGSHLLPQPGDAEKTRRAKFFSRSHHAVIPVQNEAGNVIETHEHAGEFKGWQAGLPLAPTGAAAELRAPVGLCLVRNMKPGTGTIILVAALLAAFGIELASHSVGNEALLLKLGALPDNGELHSQYWRLATYSLLHLNGTHLLVNAMLLLWIGRIVESRVNIADASAIYVSSVLCSAALILLVHHLYPKAGATMGASGGVFGLLAAAFIISYRQKAEPLDRRSRLRTLLWIALLVGLGISLLPGISMAGHVGGLIGGAVVAPVARLRKNV